MAWEPVIGLEIHTQLATRSKIFSGAATTYGAEPNRQACAIDLGLPGVLPVLNHRAVTMALMFGLSVNAEIAPQSVFARKNYFYPDLPKGYQISQFEFPIVGTASINIMTDEGVEKTIGITRAHLEEDAGKSLHENFHGMTGIDLNRAGTPLLEIVSEPDMRSASEAIAYMRAIHSLVCYLGICDGNMQEGSFRCDANVSVRPKGQDAFGTRTELKNINSFRFVEKAINHEIERQIMVLETGGEVTQETRLYDADNNTTRSMRSKEEAFDYRYFPCPDLLPVTVNEEQLQNIKQQLPELPQAKRQRFVDEYELSDKEAAALVSTRELAEYFETVVKQSGVSAKLVNNWVMGELAAALNKNNLTIDNSPVSSEQLAGLLKRLDDKTISGKIAKTVFEALWQGAKDADTVIEEQGLQQVTDSSAIEKLVDEVIANHPEQVDQYRSGKTQVLGFLVGQVMKASQGKANPGQVNGMLRDKLAK